MSLKLNLGCGKKLYPPAYDWVNVDIVEPKLDVVQIGVIDNAVNPATFDNKTPLFHPSDLKRMKFVNDSVADEIHAYHVIEHFYKEEVLDVLKEWFRVLKPGGMIALEAPDILKCSANFISGIMRGDTNFAHHLGILGFYGDGTSDQPYMGHKWGWFPESLAHQMIAAGFIDITQEEAQTHAKGMRDFRVVGYKPLERTNELPD